MNHLDHTCNQGPRAKDSVLATIGDVVWNLDTIWESVAAQEKRLLTLETIHEEAAKLHETDLLILPVGCTMTSTPWDGQEVVRVSTGPAGSGAPIVAGSHLGLYHA